MATGLLGHISDYLFGSADTGQYLQQMQAQQLQAEQARQREAQAYAAQQRYAQYLSAVLNGTAPSMAQMQLNQGLEAQRQQQASMAAGIGGGGSALARYGAAVNTGNANSALAQQQVLARVAEQNAARQLYGQNAGMMESGSRGLYGDISGNGLGYAGIASGLNKFNVGQEFLGAGSILQGVGQGASAYLSGKSPQPSQQQTFLAQQGAQYSQAAPGYEASKNAGNY